MKRRGPSESQIQQQIDELLELDGWRIIKTDLPHLRGLGVQEKGMPDRLYLRYPTSEQYDQLGYELGDAEAFWIEHKKRDGKAKEHQKAWHAAERARGALVIVAGEDFEASADGFIAWYNGSGLARRKLTISK